MDQNTLQIIEKDYTEAKYIPRDWGSHKVLYLFRINKSTEIELRPAKPKGECAYISKHGKLSIHINRMCQMKVSYW